MKARQPCRPSYAAWRLVWKSASVAVVVAAALAPAASHACGACVEDNVAATYDHQTVKSAKAAGNLMVFCAVTGQFDAWQLVKSARGVHGVKGSSVRTSGQPQALSFAFDPTRQSPEAAVDTIQRSLPAGTRLSIVRLMK